MEEGLLTPQTPFGVTEGEGARYTGRINPRTDLKIGHYIQWRNTDLRSCLRRYSGGKPPHSKMLGHV